MKERLSPEELYSELYNHYGPQGWWPVIIEDHQFEKDNRGYHKENPVFETSLKDKYEIITGAVLTQNTAWKNVEKCLIKLMENSIDSAELFLEKDENDIKSLIKSSGYYNQKYKKLKIVMEYLCAKGYLTDKKNYENRIPERSGLVDLWGIGEETADSILLYAFNVPTFVIDMYTKRLTERLNPDLEIKSYKEYKKYYENNLDRDVELYNEYHALVVKHCVEKCRKKPICSMCFLKERCSYN